MECQPPSFARNNRAFSQNPLGKITMPSDPTYPPADSSFIPTKPWTDLLAAMKRGRRNHQERMELLLRHQDAVRHQFARDFPNHTGI